jgi:hypothetical protein
MIASSGTGHREAMPAESSHCCSENGCNWARKPVKLTKETWEANCRCRCARCRLERRR